MEDCRFEKRAVRGCLVQRCKFNSKRKGWKCAPIPVSPSPSATMPDPRYEFTKRTFRSGLHATDDRTVTESGPTRDVFDVSFDMFMTKAGVVSLNGIADDVLSVACDTSGTVRIKLSKNAMVGKSLYEMYPKGAVLAVSREHFGECIISEPVNIPGSSDVDDRVRMVSKSIDMFADSYLQIKSVQGSKRNTVVFGVETSYVSLFDKGSIRITRRVDENGAQSIRSTKNQSTENAITTSARQLSVQLEEKEFSFGPVNIGTSGTLQSSSQIKSFSADWDINGLDMELIFLNEWKAMVELDLTFLTGTDFSVQIKPLLSKALYGLPPIDFLSAVDNDRFSISPFKIGFYAEAVLITRLGLNIEKQISSLARAKYKFTRTEVKLYVRGPFLDLKFGHITKTHAQSTSDFDFNPNVNGDSSVNVSLPSFIGIRPQISLYTPLFTARVSADLGVDIAGKSKHGEESAYPPVKSGRTFGVCDRCHKVQVSATGKIRNTGPFANMGMKVRVFRFFNQTLPLQKQITAVTLPGNPSIGKLLGTACIGWQFGQNTILCGES